MEDNIEFHKGDFNFVKEAFYYALLRMEELPLRKWGSLELKNQSIKEVREQQQKVLEKLERMMGDKK